MTLSLSFWINCFWFPDPSYWLFPTQSQTYVCALRKIHADYPFHNLEIFHQASRCNSSLCDSQFFGDRSNILWWAAVAYYAANLASKHQLGTAWGLPPSISLAKHLTSCQGCHAHRCDPIFPRQPTPALQGTREQQRAAKRCTSIALGPVILSQVRQLPPTCQPAVSSCMGHFLPATIVAIVLIASLPECKHPSCDETGRR